MGGCEVDLKKRHFLNTEFASLLITFSTLLDKCVEYKKLKLFLKLLSHPLYPEKRYIETTVIQSAESVADLLTDCLFPKYINYMEYDL